MLGRSFWCILVLTGLTVVGQRAARGEREQSRLVKTIVQFQLYKDYLIVVQGSVGPLKGLNFLLDTGANTTVLDSRVARKLGLDATPTGVAVLGGSVEGGMATAPSVEFGPIRRDNVRVLIKELPFIRGAVPFQIDAIVGLDVLGQSEFEIDYSAREIRFGAPRAMPDSVPLQMENGLVFVDAVVNHTKARLLVDTGAPSLVMFQETAEAKAGVKGGDAQMSTKKIGDFDRRRVREISLRLGEVEFGHEAVFVVPNLRDAGHDFDGVISPAALGFTRVAVDLNQRTMAFSREQ